MEQYLGQTDQGQEFLLTKWDDGSHEVATRRHSWETWSPPIDMRLISAPSIAAEAQQTRAAKA